jgi:serine/threonine-protein kinase
MRAGQLRKGSMLGKYRLERRLGRGSYATVWKARDTVENRHVALKIVAPQLEDEFGRAGIEREARVASRLSHPNIVTVRNADWVDGLFILATDLARTSLADYRGARRSPRVALRILREIAAGLAYAHSQRVLHLDLKPENIMIFADGRAAIGDFGTSRFARGATRTYIEAGTLGYMAPEQAYGRARLASDVFALGMIAYELLAGRLLTWPFSWPPDDFRRFRERVPVPLQPVFKKAAAFDPRRRFADGMALHKALESAFHKVEAARNHQPARRGDPRAARSPLAIEADLFRRRHGAGLGMVVRCHHCEGPIAEAMSHCPWCGSSENSFRGVTRLPLVCPECERGVRPEWTACPWCYRGRFEGDGRRPRPDPGAERNCSRRGCAGELRVFMRYCPLCKQKPKRAWTHEGLPDRCPRCRWPVSRQFWRHCPWCGRREPRAGTFAHRRSARN